MNLPLNPEYDPNGGYSMLSRHLIFAKNLHVLILSQLLKRRLQWIQKFDDLFQVNVLRRGRGLGTRVLRGGAAQKAWWPSTHAQN